VVRSPGLVDGDTVRCPTPRLFNLRTTAKPAGAAEPSAAAASVRDQLYPVQKTITPASGARPKAIATVGGAALPSDLLRRHVRSAITMSAAP
jgi:hypothetical protein